MWVFACFRNFLHIQRWDFFFFTFLSFLVFCENVINRAGNMNVNILLTDRRRYRRRTRQRWPVKPDFSIAERRKHPPTVVSPLYCERDDSNFNAGYNNFFFFFHLPQSKTFSTVLFSRSYRAHVKNTTKNSLYFYNKIKILCLNITCASTNNIGPSTLQCVFKF